ncbi:MAG: hypothetical protein OHK0029_38100 [Armatimonadaceae bacterium]
MAGSSQATSSAPAVPSSRQILPGALQSVRLPLVVTETAQFLWRDKRALLFLGAYILAWWVPLTWCWDRWGDPRSIAAIQFLIPLLSFLLIWARRREITEAVMYVPNPSRNFWKRGNPVVLAIGCLGLLFSHLIHLKGIAVLSLLLIPVGAAYWMFGGVIFRVAWVPILFSLLAIPPPDSITDAIARVSLYGGLAAAKLAYAVFRIPTTVDPRGLLRFDSLGFTAELNTAVSLGAAVLPALAIIWWYALYRRFNARQTVSFLILGFLISLILGVLKCMIVARLQGISPSLSGFLLTSEMITPDDFIRDGALNMDGIGRVFAGTFLAGFWLALCLGLTVIASRIFKVRVEAEQIARPTGAVVNRVGRGVGFLFSPLVLLVNLLTRIGTLFKRSERAIENMFRRYSRRKRKGGW